MRKSCSTRDPKGQVRATDLCDRIRSDHRPAYTRSVVPETGIGDYDAAKKGPISKRHKAIGGGDVRAAARYPGVCG